MYPGVLSVTIEDLGHASSMEALIAFCATPGEPMVRYYWDGSGYPGSPPECELQAVHVTRWHVGDEQRNRGTSWIWKDLDRIAEAIIDDDWSHYSACCLEDVAAHTEDTRY